MRISDWSSDVCSSDLSAPTAHRIRSRCAERAPRYKVDRNDLHDPRPRPPALWPRRRSRIELRYARSWRFRREWPDAAHLVEARALLGRLRLEPHPADTSRHPQISCALFETRTRNAGAGRCLADPRPDDARPARKSVASGKSVDVRVNLGGSRSLK